MLRRYVLIAALLVAVTFSINEAHAQVSSGGAVGFKVLPNPEHLSPLQWYNTYIPSANRGTPSEIEIDGYQAVEDGRSVYVNAANYVGGTLYTNIYVFSYDANDPDGFTREIYDKITERLHFTIIPPFTAPGLGRCAGTGKRCESRFDCEDTSTACLNSSGEEIRRDTKRISDIVTFNDKLRVFRNAFGNLPQLLAGSFIEGVSYSTWPSWRLTLSDALGESLAVDPINKFLCPDGTDQVTCWDAVSRTFACPTDGYAYGYAYEQAASPGLQERAIFGANFEHQFAQSQWGGGATSIGNCNVGFSIGTQNDTDADGIPNGLDNCDASSNPNQQDSDADGRGDFCDVCPFDPYNDSDNDNFCADVDNCPYVSNPNQQDSNGNGVGDACENACGDGVIDTSAGEECDPLVLTEPPLCSFDTPNTYGVVSCYGPEAGSQACTWNFSLCTSGTCGNGFVEPSEECEIGDFEIEACIAPRGYNGLQRRDCSGSCSWQPYNTVGGTTNTCAPLGFCGDGILQPEAEECDDGTANGSDHTCNDSCRIQDCPNCGTTCGNDNVDPGEVCGDGGLPLTTTCNAIGLPGSANVDCKMVSQGYSENECRWDRLSL